MSEPSPLPETVVRLGKPGEPPRVEPAATVIRSPAADAVSPASPAAASSADKTLITSPLGAVPLGITPAAASVRLAEPRQFGDYELLEEIARGGMGVVFKARQAGLNRTVALKMILAGKLADESAVRRFYNEAESAARLKHPHIVAIHDVGFCQGQHYFSMEFVAGQSLADAIRRRLLTPETGAALVRAVALAIHYAHSQGVLHRDLKPANVLIDADGQPRVTDFGLAKRLEGDGDLTSTGMVLGSPNYMSPEQAMARHELVGPASDVYALGAVLFEVLTGRPPFSSENLALTLYDVVHAEPPLPRSLAPQTPRDLETICLKCLAKDPGERYATAADLAADLELFLRGEPITARPLGLVERTLRWARRWPFLASIYGFAITFYTFHLLSFGFPRGMTWTFHWQITAILAMWVAAGVVLHSRLQSPRHRLAAGYGMMLVSVVAATLGLSLDRGAASAPAIILMTVIPVAPLLLPSARLIVFTTLAAIACYSGLALYAWRWAPDNIVPTDQFAAFVMGQVALGLTAYLWVRGVRVVSAELSGSQALSADRAHRDEPTDATR